MYDIEISPAADRDLIKLRKKITRDDLTRSIPAIDSLGADPRPAGARKIVGAAGAYRIRVGDYRVIYEIADKDRLIILLHITRRSEDTYQ